MRLLFAKIRSRLSLFVLIEQTKNARSEVQRHFATSRRKNSRFSSTVSFERNWKISAAKERRSSGTSSLYREPRKLSLVLSFSVRGTFHRRHGKWRNFVIKEIKRSQNLNDNQQDKNVSLHRLYVDVRILVNINLRCKRKLETHEWHFYQDVFLNIYDIFLSHKANGRVNFSALRRLWQSFALRSKILSYRGIYRTMSRDIKS